MCLLVYFVDSGKDIFMFTTILLNSSYCYIIFLEKDLKKSVEFLSFIAVFKGKLPIEEYQIIVKDFFNSCDRSTLINKKIKKTIIAINIISFVILIFTTVRELHGL
jgi:hypothetical protein